MPYKSQRQRAWAHSEEGMKALGGPSKVAEWDQASQGMDLPERVAPKKQPKKAEPNSYRSSGIRWVK